MFYVIVCLFRVYSFLTTFRTNCENTGIVLEETVIKRYFILSVVFFFIHLMKKGKNLKRVVSFYQPTKTSPNNTVVAALAFLGRCVLGCFQLGKVFGSPSAGVKYSRAELVSSHPPLITLLVCRYQPPTSSQSRVTLFKWFWRRAGLRKSYSLTPVS